MLIRLTRLRNTAERQCALTKEGRSLWQSHNSNEGLPVASAQGVRVQNSLQKVRPGVAEMELCHKAQLQRNSYRRMELADSVHVFGQSHANPDKCMRQGGWSGGQQETRFW